MKLKIVAVSAVALVSVGMVGTGNARINIGIGIPAPAVLAIAPPNFVMMPDLGVYAAVGISQDLFYDGSLYYLNQGGYWYSSSYYGGPWVYVANNRMPMAFRRYNLARFRTSRGNVYRSYRRGGFRGQQYRPVQRPAPGRPGPGGGGHRR